MVRSLSMIAVVLMIAGAGVIRPAAGQNPSPNLDLAPVTEVIDGNTIEVELYGKLERVRYIGINTPQQGQPCAREAMEANTALVAGQTVALMRDVQDTAQDGLLLRYVYVGGEFVNAALIAGGWAEAVRSEPDTAYAAWFEWLESEAMSTNAGCWAFNVFDVRSEGEEADTAAGVTVTANSPVNVRSGPGTNYGVVSQLATGDTAVAVGRNGE